LIVPDMDASAPRVSLISETKSFHLSIFFRTGWSASQRASAVGKPLTQQESRPSASQNTPCTT
jgi:hypothetical protein